MNEGQVFFGGGPSLRAGEGGRRHFLFSFRFPRGIIPYNNRGGSRRTPMERTRGYAREDGAGGAETQPGGHICRADRHRPRGHRGPAQRGHRHPGGGGPPRRRGRAAPGRGEQRADCHPVPLPLRPDDPGDSRREAGPPRRGPL